MISWVTPLSAHVLGRAVASIAAVFVMGSAQAQINPSLFQGMQWRNIGPFIAGKVDSVSGVSGRPAIAYVGTDNGGVWKTVNAGPLGCPLPMPWSLSGASPHWR